MQLTKVPKTENTIRIPYPIISIIQNTKTTIHKYKNPIRTPYKNGKIRNIQTIPENNKKCHIHTRILPNNTRIYKNYNKNENQKVLKIINIPPQHQNNV